MSSSTSEEDTWMMTFKENAGQANSMARAGHFFPQTSWLKGEGEAGKEKFLHGSYYSSIVSFCLKQRIVFYWHRTRWTAYFDT